MFAAEFPTTMRWCRRQESNLHGSFPPRDFKSHASTVPPRRHARRTIGGLPALPQGAALIKTSPSRFSPPATELGFTRVRHRKLAGGTEGRSPAKSEGGAGEAAPY